MKNLELLRKEMRSANVDGLVNIRSERFFGKGTKNITIFHVSGQRLRLRRSCFVYAEKGLQTRPCPWFDGRYFLQKRKSCGAVLCGQGVRKLRINDFETNRDHFTPDFEYFLAKGIGGVIKDIEISRSKYASDPSKERISAPPAARYALEGLFVYGTFLCGHCGKTRQNRRGSDVSAIL